MERTDGKSLDAIPATDSTGNTYVRDVVGSKNDTAAGNSLVALIKAVAAALVSFLVPAADAADNVDWGDVIGNKSDAAADGATASLVALVREAIGESERHDEHFHNTERWWGAVAVPDETNAIDANVDNDFAATSGNNTWGAAIPILGTADDPSPVGQLLFDPHRVIFTDLDADTSLWRFRIIYGYGTSAAAIGAGQWSEVPVIAADTNGNRAGGVASDIKIIALSVGIKLWAQSWNATNGEILSFQWGSHGYPAPAAPTAP